MKTDRLLALRVAAAASDGLLLGALWWALVQLRFVAQVGGWAPEGWATIHPQSLVAMGWLVVPMWVLVLVLKGSYVGVRRPGVWRLLWQTAVNSSLALMGCLTWLYLADVEISRAVLVVHGALAWPLLVLARLGQSKALGWLRQRAFDPHTVAVVGDEEAVHAWAALSAAHPEWGIRPAVRVSEEGLSQLPALLQRHSIREVHVACTLSNEQLSTLSSWCTELGLVFSIDASFLGYGADEVSLDDMGDVLRLSFVSDSKTVERATKRALDVVASVALLFVLSPFLALIALRVRADQSGPVFFRQERVGRHGKLFQIVKFRTMSAGAENQWQNVIGLGPKPTVDPRVTELGRVLRRYSVDELPQLYNVLRGEMSLVGPRPPLPLEVASGGWRARRRLAVLPGMTGLWQVSGRADLGREEGIDVDLDYIEKWNLWLDLTVLLRTLPAVIRGTGAR